MKSPGIMLGYVGNEEGTSESIDEEGWLHTGDIGYYDENGKIYVIDRIKEMIKVRDMQVRWPRRSSRGNKHQWVSPAPTSNFVGCTCRNRKCHCWNTWSHRSRSCWNPARDRHFPAQSSRGQT